MKNGKTVVSGMRPTGRLHLGNWFGALKNWIELQEKYSCFFFIADWHSLTTLRGDYSGISADSMEMLADWLAAGLDPEKCVIFRQSDIKEHAELYLLLGMITPTGWLLRNPTFKEQLHNLYMEKYKGQEDKVRKASGASRKIMTFAGLDEDEFASDLSTFGFLGYPVLQAADILLYNADFVPVGKDQLPHLELSREMARRFNKIFGGVFREPSPILAETPLVPGLDGTGRKMSKSYGNTIMLGEETGSLRKKVMSMYTDPSKAKADDPGHPEGCVVFSFFRLYDPSYAEELRPVCEKGEVGCVECKKRLFETMAEHMEEFSRKRKEIDKSSLDSVLRDGGKKASDTARAMMEKINSAVLG